MQLKARLLLLSLALATSSCTTPLRDETRVHLGEQSFFELRLPEQWEFRSKYASGHPTVELISIFAPGREVLQQICTKTPIQERLLPDGLALFCSLKDGTADQETFGVLVNPRMTAEF